MARQGRFPGRSVVPARSAVPARPHPPPCSLPCLRSGVQAAKLMHVLLQDLMPLTYIGPWVAPDHASCARRVQRLSHVPACAQELSRTYALHVVDLRAGTAGLSMMLLTRCTELYRQASRRSNEPNQRKRACPKGIKQIRSDEGHAQSARPAQLNLQSALPAKSAAISIRQPPAINQRPTRYIPYASS